MVGLPLRAAYGLNSHLSLETCAQPSVITGEHPPPKRTGELAWECRWIWLPHRGVDQAVPNAVFSLKPEGFHFSSESP